MADERLVDAGLEAFLRWDLLPADLTMGPSRVRRHPAGDRAGLAGRAREGRAIGGSDDDAVAGYGAAVAGLDSPRRRCARAHRGAVSRDVRRPIRRLRRRPEVSAPLRAVVPAAGTC